MESGVIEYDCGAGLEAGVSIGCGEGDVNSDGACIGYGFGSGTGYCYDLGECNGSVDIYGRGDERGDCSGGGYGNGSGHGNGTGYGSSYSTGRG